MTRYRHTFRAALALAAALSLLGCGRRGPLEPPPGASATNAPLASVPNAGLPTNTETAPIDAAATPAAASIGGSAPSPLPPPAKAPAKPFPLDPLL
ncbi:MAG: LPS translocon maturation chaperone LptM [Methylocella sp.]